MSRDPDQAFWNGFVWGIFVGMAIIGIIGGGR